MAQIFLTTLISRNFEFALWGVSYNPLTEEFFSFSRASYHGNELQESAPGVEREERPGSEARICGQALRHHAARQET